MQAFNAVQSFHSDSAVAFALFLNHLPDMHTRPQPAQLLAAIEVRLPQDHLDVAARLRWQYCDVSLVARRQCGGIKRPSAE